MQKYAANNNNDNATSYSSQIKPMNQPLIHLNVFFNRLKSIKKGI